RRFERQRQFRVANIERVQKRLMMEKRGVINIENDLADEREGVTAVLITENANVSRDQTTERIQSETADRRFNAAPVQFLDDSRARPSAETFPRQVPPTADR